MAGADTTAAESRRQAVRLLMSPAVLMRADAAPGALPRGFDVAVARPFRLPTLVSAATWTVCDGVDVRGLFSHN